MRSAETPDAHHPEDQIINKTFDKTKEKVYFSRSLRLPDASINEKMGGYRRLQPAACFGGTVANGPISDTERLCWQKSMRVLRFAQTAGGRTPSWWGVAGKCSVGIGVSVRSRLIVMPLP